MYGLDIDTDLSFLLGKELIQLCIGQFDIILNFKGNVSIAVESTFEVGSRGRWQPKQKLPDAACALVGLLGAEVSKVDIPENGTLLLLFSNEGMFRVYDSRTEAESYNITGGPDGVIVV